MLESQDTALFDGHLSLTWLPIYQIPQWWFWQPPNRGPNPSKLDPHPQKCLCCRGRWWHQLCRCIGQNHHKGRGSSGGRRLEPHTTSRPRRKAMVMSTQQDTTINRDTGRGERGLRRRLIEMQQSAKIEGEILLKIQPLSWTVVVTVDQINNPLNSIF